MGPKCVSNDSLTTMVHQHQTATFNAAHGLEQVQFHLIHPYPQSLAELVTKMEIFMVPMVPMVPVPLHVNWCGYQYISVTLW